MIRLAFTRSDFDRIRQRVTEMSPAETGAFFILHTGKYNGGIRLVASKPYFPAVSEYDQVGPHQLTPSARLLSAMVGRAQRENAGLLFVHSHPNPNHPTGFSPTDREALHSLGQVIPDLIDGPFAAAVVGPKGVVGELHTDGMWKPIDRITAAGRGLQILDPIALEELTDIDNRQAPALGGVHTQLKRLDVAIVGTGGLGSPLAETLVRMGIRKLTIIDKGRLDTLSNVRRVFGSNVSDFHRAEARSKAFVVADHCRRIGLETEVVDILGDVRHRRVFEHLLGSDVVFSATDSHSSRAVIDAAAYAFNLLVIDAGVRVGMRQKEILASLISELRVIGPDLPCLWCRNVLSSETIREENLPTDQREVLAREGYVVGAGEPEPSVAALTVLGAGMMASALLGALSEDSDILPDNYMFDGLLGDAPRVDTRGVAKDCICRARYGKGDQAPLGLIPNEIGRRVIPTDREQVREVKTRAPK